MIGCPDVDTLTRLLQNQLECDRATSVAAHIEYCGGCQATLDRLTQEEDEPTGVLLRKLKGSNSFSPDHVPEPSPGWFLSLADSPAGPTPDTRPRVEGYEILDEIGRGGMAVVYRARHVGLNRLVALKMLPVGQFTGEFRQRLRREAQALARLQHPNIVQVYDIGEQGDRPYLALELVEGTTLAQWTKWAPRPPQEAAEFVLTIAAAVNCAHQNGILHCDLKPANILLQGVEGIGPGPDRAFTPASTLKVSDFGLARAVRSPDSPAGPPTEAGRILGTPSYMAPEQVSARTVGPPADVYALGTILYELLTGGPPFRSATPIQTLLRVVREEPLPVQRLQPRLPRDLATICMKCLEKDPDRRYRTAGELADDLRRFLNHEPIWARPVGPVGRLARWSRRQPAVATMLFATVGVVTLAFAVVLWQLDETDIARRRAEKLAESESSAHVVARSRWDEAETAKLRAERVSAELVLDQSLEWCMRGDTAAGLLGLARGLSRATDAGLADLQPVFRLNLALWANQHLTFVKSPGLGASVTSVAFSPDGKRLITGQWANKWREPGPGEAQLWDPEGFKPIGPPLTHPGPITAVTFSPSGTQVLTGGLDGTVRLWDAATGRSVSEMRGLGAVTSVAFSPDGLTFAAGGCPAHSPTDGGELRVWSTSPGYSAIATVAQPGKVFAVTYHPDGKSLGFGCLVNATPGGAAGGQARVLDVRSGKPIGPDLLHSAAVKAVAFDGAGKLLLVGCADNTALLWDWAAGKRLGEPLQHPQGVNAVAFSPDGDTLLTAYGSVSHGMGRGGTQLWDRHTLKPFTSPLVHPEVVHSAVFRPDGRVIATGCRDGLVRLCPFGNFRPTVDCRHPFSLSAVDFSPDGKLVAVGGGGPDQPVGRSRLYEVARGRAIGPELEHPSPVTALAFSPDGHSYAAVCRDGGGRTWEVGTDRPVGPQLQSPPAPDNLSFSTDGRNLLVSAHADAVSLWNVSTGRPAWGDSMANGSVLISAFSPDKRMVMTGERKGIARVWESATGRLVTALSDDSPAEVQSCAFSADGRRLLTGRVDGVARIWNAATGQSVGLPLDHDGEVVWKVGFVAGDERIYTIAGPFKRDRGTVRLWDATGRLLGRLPGRVASRAVAVHHGRELLATGGWSGDLRLWDARSCRPVGPPLPCRGAAAAVAFSPDGLSLAVVDGDGTLRVWPIPAGYEGSPAAAAAWVQRLSEMPGQPASP